MCYFTQNNVLIKYKCVEKEVRGFFMKKKNTKQTGFSLAEALITLTIIGIIAMLVVPGLRKYSSKHAFAAQLKKDYMTLNNSLDYVLADDFEVDIEEMGGSAFFLEKMVPTFNTIMQCSGSNMYASEGGRGCFGTDSQGLSVTPSNAVMLADGSTIGNSNMYYIIDVNGPNLPNIEGADIFMYELRRVKSDFKTPDAEDDETTGTVAMLTPVVNGALNKISNVFVAPAYADQQYYKENEYGEQEFEPEDERRGGAYIPDNPKPDNPKPDNKTPDNPKPDNQTPDNPKPDNPTPDNPKPANPTPDNPTPDNPKPANPTPDNPTPANPTPNNPTPNNPTPATPNSSSSSGGYNSGSVTSDGTYTAGWRFVPIGKAKEVMDNGWKIEDWD